LLNLNFFISAAMKLSLSILVVLSLVVLLMPDFSSSLPAGQQLRKKNARPQVAAPAPRTGRKLSKPTLLRNKQVSLKRRGKQDGSEVAPPPPTTEEGGAAPAAEGDAAASDVPAWCDPQKEMGAWLNFVKMRKWCADHGYTNFGPYGGVPAEMEAADAAADGAPAADAAEGEESA
jgi:hypothetical protein